MIGINVYQREEKEPGCFYLRSLRLQEQRTHMKKEKQRHEERREKVKQASEQRERVRKRGGQSEIIIIIEVVFQGQYLRFSSTVSLKHNPPQPSPSLAPLHRCLQASSYLSLPSSPIPTLFSCHSSSRRRLCPIPLVTDSHEPKLQPTAAAQLFKHMTN